MERLLSWEDNTASFPFASKSKQFTFLMAWGHVHSAIVQKVCLTLTWKSQRKVGLTELLQYKEEPSVSTWGDSEISKSLVTDKEDRETVAWWAYFSDLFFDVTIFTIILHIKAVLDPHNNFQQTEEIKAFPEL